MPSEPHPRPEADRRGRSIEDRLHARLRQAKADGTVEEFLQPDSVVLSADGELFLVEAKGQSHFTKPPFDGHGLPKVQALRYQAVFEKFGIRTKLIVWDDVTVWWQWIDVLEAGRKFDTEGKVKTPRRIYPLDSFKRVDSWH